MPSPSEPLLPVEHPPRSGLTLWIGLGAAAVLLAGAAFHLASRGGNDAPSQAPAAGPAESTPRPSKADPGPRTRQEPSSGSSEERQARELYEAAEAFERAEPGEYEQRIQRWRDVVTKFPTTAWARKADEKHRAASKSLQTLLDREFEGTRKDAQALAAAGHYVDAIEAIQTYRASQSRDLLKRRADVEISALENAARSAYNETAARARERAAKGDYSGALALLESAAPGAPPDVAARCRASISQLQASKAARDRFELSHKGDEARRSFREEQAPKILALVRARKYDDALKELSAAAAAPGNASIKEEISAERAGVADASSFWEAFLKSLRSRTGQDATLLLADGKRISGRISRVQDDRVSIETGDAPAETALDRLHADLLVGWTIGKTLAAEDALTYVKAALFFFCDGRDDLARLYLATARELNGPVPPAEKVFREGYLRAASAVRK
jgi:hypothetical protein